MKKKTIIFVCIIAILITTALIVVKESRSCDRRCFNENYLALAQGESIDLISCFFYVTWGTEEVAYFCEKWTNYYTLFPCVLGYRVPMLTGECVYAVNP